MNREQIDVALMLLTVMFYRVSIHKDAKGRMLYCGHRMEIAG